MTTQIDRAVALLFPEQGRRAIDVKFFCEPDATEEAIQIMRQAWSDEPVRFSGRRYCIDGIDARC